MNLVEGEADIDDLEGFLDALDGIAAEHGCTVQAFDARYVVSREHLRRAVELADRAIVRGEAVARNRGVEILLYAAGRRQIDRALTLGVSEGRLPTVVLVDAPPPDVRAADVDVPGTDGDDTDDTGGTTSGDGAAGAAAVADLLDPAATLGEYDPERVREFFGVGAAELDAAAADLPALVLERVALLDVEK